MSPTQQSSACPEHDTIINAPVMDASELVHLLVSLPSKWDVAYFSGRAKSSEIDQYAGHDAGSVPAHDDIAYDVVTIMVSPPCIQAAGVFRVTPDYEYSRDAGGVGQSSPLGTGLIQPT